MKNLISLIPYLWRYRKLLWIGLAWLAVTAALALAIPWMLKVGVDALAAERYGDIARYAGILALAALVRGITRIFSRQKYLHTARRVEIDLRRDLLERLLDQPAPFFDRHRTGDLLSRFTNDLANVRMLAGFGLLTLLNTGLIYLSTLVVLLVISPSLTLVALIPYPLMLLLVKYLSRHLLQHSTLVQEGVGKVSEAVEEGVSGQAVIRAYDLHGARTRAFDRLNEEYLERNLVLARLRALILPVMTLVGPLGTLLVIYFGGSRVAGGTLTLGELVAFNAYLMQLAWPTLLLGWVLTLLQRAAASMERLNTLLDLPVSPAPAEPAGHLASPPTVRVHGLNFTYGEKSVLHDLHLEVPAGALVGVTGPTAAGKSTLLRLLANLYPAPPGTVFIDGEDLARANGHRHRGRLAAVPQEGRLFSGTVRENLLYAVPEADEVRLAVVAREVRLDQEIAAFADGFDTRVGEGGLSLSGGQRQRVSLGRALARGGMLWLLDDPFSHLDAATAQAIWKKLRPLLAGRTVFLVSGRVSLLSAVDRILVLEGGRLVQQGTHDQLLRQGGLYARLVARERLEAEMDGFSDPLELRS